MSSSDEFTFVPDDILTTMPPAPLQRYPDIHPADTAMGLDPDITPWSASEPPRLSPSGVRPFSASLLSRLNDTYTVDESTNKGRGFFSSIMSGKRSSLKQRFSEPQPLHREPLLPVSDGLSPTKDVVDTSTVSATICDHSFESSNITLAGISSPFSPPVTLKYGHRGDHKISPMTITQLYDSHIDGEHTSEEWRSAIESWDGSDGASSVSEKGTIPSSSLVSSGEFVLARIYLANGSYHVAKFPLHTTVADLTPFLDARICNHESRTHKLYLKERRKERILALTERPGEIARCCLEQAGYAQFDGLDYMAAENMSFILKFIYKSQQLGPQDLDMNNNFDCVDLAGCGLSAIPIVFHENAASIIYFNISRNPMLEIPLDFIHSCIALRELRMSNMTMKKVPRSVRHSIALNRLDLSSNHIIDLDDAGLDFIPQLSVLKLQNNRIEQLPWYFPRLRMLKALNISNNAFSHFPSVICEMSSLRDLDVSFNMIMELPETIGRLTALELLIFVGNQVSKLPEQCSQLVNLRTLDCRRNILTDLSTLCTIPQLEKLLADHNVIHAFDLSHIPNGMTVLDISFNDIALVKPTSFIQIPLSLTSLDVSHTKLSSLDESAMPHLSALQNLKLDHNLFRSLPNFLGELVHLVTLSCSNNYLEALPETIGSLQRLESLDAHNNSLKELPLSLWDCSSLALINVTSNLINTWHDSLDIMLLPMLPPHLQFVRKVSSSTTHGPCNRPTPPLAYSLEKLYVGGNRFTGDRVAPFMILKELRVLNLSFNEIQELPSSFLRNLTKLEELYLSGNTLASIPTEDLCRLTQLRALFLNRNKLQTLPQELGKVLSLTVIDVGSNMLRYNINNWHFDWNWNFNPNLRYLNLSGNKRLEIKIDSDSRRLSDWVERDRSQILADFSESLRMLSLMDVTTAFLPTIPKDTEDRRVRTTLSEINRMSYGIADTLGSTGYLTMFDLVQPEFRGRKDEAVFAMFGRSDAQQSNNHLSKYLHDNFLLQFTRHLNQINVSKSETVPDALRRTFLKLNQGLHDTFYTSDSSPRKMSQESTLTARMAVPEISYRAGASGIVVYFVGKTIYVANAGDILAVISTQGSAELFSRKHDPFDPREMERIRAAEGWVSPKGLVNDEVDTSRSFGHFYHFPVVNARPDVKERQLTEQDEFMIIGNRGIWDHISYQAAVNIARSEIADPIIAAQKLRDFAISYGSDGSIMVMVICLSDWLRPTRQ